jgi:hypothetical protein
VIECLKGKIHEEIRDLREMQPIHREHYLLCCHDYGTALRRDDPLASSQTALYMRYHVGEMWHLIRQQQSTYRRLTGMVAGRHDPSAISPDTEAQVSRIRLAKTRHKDG